MMITKDIATLIEEPISGEWGEEGSGVKVIRTTNFTNYGRLNMDEVVERNVEAHKVSKKRLKYGDIILEKSGGGPKQPVGRVVYFDIDNGDTFLCNNFTAIIRPKEEVHPRFLFWFLFFNHISNNTLRFQNKTTGINNLQLSKYLASLKVPLPEFQAQEKIATILDKADGLRQTDQHLIKKYDELLENVFYQIFGDPAKNERRYQFELVEKLLIDAKEGTKCGPFGSALKKDEYVKSGIPVWVMDNIAGTNFVEDGCLFITQKKYEQLKAYTVRNGDIIISRAGTVGKMTVINTSVPNSIISTNLIKLSLDKSKISPYYFIYLMKFHGHKLGRLKRGSDGSFSHMNSGIIRTLKIPLPDMNSQNIFEKTLQNIIAQKKVISESSNLSESLFQSLLHKAFNGALEV